MMRFVRLTVVDLALAALGCWSLWAQLVYRSPSRVLGVGLALLVLALTAGTLVLWLRGALHLLGTNWRKRRPFAFVAHACALGVLGFCFYSLFLFTNGKFDLSEPVPHATEIIRMGMDESALGVALPIVWADVRSWRTSGEVERLLLSPEEQQRLWGGQAVVVSVRQGFYGVPWVSRVEADMEKHSRAVLVALPNASQIRKDLAAFYTRVGRFSDAAATAREYVERFPEDRAFPVWIARLLTSHDRFADVITVLTPVAPRHEDADVYMLLGYSMAMHGKRPEGLAYLERARKMQPDNWWPHYALGWAYGAGGDYRRAVTSFEKAVALRRGLADAERELRRLRPLVAGAPTS
jgi:hypothetical protein